MNAEQLHYTSCRHGRSGHAGFQVRSASPGLAAHERQEIERRAGYRPPRDLPRQPTPEQIAEEFPVALRYAPLEGGRALLLRATYCGRDYSNRWGNFFAHALTFDVRGLGDTWPVDHADWPGWRGCLAPEEDREGANVELPAVELPSREPGGPFGWDDLREFLAESPERPERLAEMGRAVLLADTDSRRLVVRDLRTAGWYWVACVTKLFPPRHARRLSFSTYEDDPRGAARINATCGETDFTFDESQRRFQFYAFDLVGGTCSEVPASADDYPAVAATWLAEDPERLQEFFAFMDHFDHKEPTGELRSALRLFQVSQGASLPAGETLQGMIRFAATHATDAGRLRIVDLLAGAADAARRTLGTEERRALLRFFIETAASTGQREHRGLAYQTWLATVDAVLQGATDPAVAEADEGLLRDRLAPHFHELAKMFLGRLPAGAMERERLDVALFLLRATARMLDTLGRTPPWKQQEVVALSRAILAMGGELLPRVTPLFELAGETAEGIGAVCRLALEADIDGEPLGRALAGFLAGQPTALAGEVRWRLDEEETWPVLFGEWLEVCDRSSDPATEFRRYRRKVLDALPGYGERYRAAVTSSILDALPREKRLPLVREWLHAGEVEGFPRDLAARCLEVANAAVDLLSDGEDAGDWSRRLAEVAAVQDIDLRPDRPALRESLGRLREGSRLRGRKAKSKTSGGDDRFAPEQLRNDLVALPSQEYQRVVATVLPEALGYVSDPDVHRRLLFAFHRADEGRAFAKAYRGFLGTHPRGAWPPSLAAALDVYLDLDPAEPRSKPLLEIEKPLRSTLVSALRRLSRDAFLAVCREQRKTRSPRKGPRWKELETTVRRRRRGVLARVKSLLPWTRKKGRNRV